MSYDSLQQDIEKKISKYKQKVEEGYYTYYYYQALDLLDKYNVYKYGLYISTICADIKGIDKKEINVIRENFPILSKSDIKIHPIEIASILNIKPSSYLKEIMDNLEKDIIYGNVINEYEEIVSYIKEKYE